MGNIEGQLIEVISKHYAVVPEAVTPTSTFRDLDDDSLDFIELILVVEDIFNIEVSDGAVKRFQTVGDLAAFIKTKRM